MASTLNKKLPVITKAKFCFCKSAGVEMKNKIFIGHNGKFSQKVGFKVANKAYKHQVQYRMKSLYNLDNVPKKGTGWTTPTAWKCARVVKNGSGTTVVSKNATEENKPANEWMWSNVGVNKKSDYIAWQMFSGYTIPDDYYARCFEFRVRTYNRAKKKHGRWITKQLFVYKKPTVSNVIIKATAKGGMRIFFNCDSFGRKFRFELGSVINIDEGRELFKSEKPKSYTLKQLSGGIYQVIIPPKDLKHKIGYADRLHIQARVVITDTGNAVGYFPELNQVQGTFNDIPIDVSYDWNENKGIYTVEITNRSATKLDDVGVTFTYNYNGKKYSVPEVKRTEDLGVNKTSTLVCLPPIGIELQMEIIAENYLGEHKKINNTLTLTGKGYRLNSIDNPTSVLGIVWGNTALTIEDEPVYETYLPFGRKQNMIFYGTGVGKNITLEGVLVDRTGMYGGQWQRKPAWDKIKNSPGLYLLRSSNGEMFEVGLTKATLQHSQKDLYEITLEMVEVEQSYGF